MIFSIADAANHNLTFIWQQGWKSAHSPGFEGLEETCWTGHIHRLQLSSIRLRDEEDTLIRPKNLGPGNYKAKLGYKVISLRSSKENQSGGGKVFGRLKLN